MEGRPPAVEQYLETILELEEAGIVPMRARIVERLGVSAPAVSETVKRLEREGCGSRDHTRGPGGAGPARVGGASVERLVVSAPAVSETVKRLEREGYVSVDQDRVLHL